MKQGNAFARRSAMVVAIALVLWAVCVLGMALGYTAFRMLAKREIDMIHHLIALRWYVLGVGIPFWLTFSTVASVTAWRRGYRRAASL